MLTHPPLHDGVSRSAASLLQRSFKAGGSVHTTCVIAGRSATATAWPPDAADMAAACPARTALLCSTVSNPSAPADRQARN
ncbi:hypothetical protein SORBI_3001G247200 [Sorghum bicolor]|uniref:Uncharacterized protein n=1 Tax=Sorghum bicolor TaxID=4558 RepID=A0A1Z5S765_SORBI|nr:hypothetical protein SORBI_3001G247200 [Sorghum bicolor]